MQAAHYDGSTGEVAWLPARPPDGPSSQAAPRQAVVPGMPPHAAVTLLRAGHRRFLSGAVTQPETTRREQLLHGQRPTAIVLTCSDARVTPESVFDTGLGDLYVIRVSGHVVSDDALASVDYAIAKTGASLVVVMGHRGCDAVTAAVTPERGRPTASMRELRRRITPAVRRAQAEGCQGRALLSRAEELHVLGSIGELHKRSALVRQRVGENSLGLVPVVYDLETGELVWLRDDSNDRSAGLAEIAHRPEATERGRAGEVPGVTFNTMVPPATPPGGATRPGELHRKGDSHVLLGNLLLAFMVITTGGAAILLLRGRRSWQPGAAEEI